MTTVKTIPRSSTSSSFAADGPAAPSPNRLNAHVARLLDDAALTLEQQQANPFRVQAYHNAASTVRALPRGVLQIYHEEGMDGLDRLPGIGPALARAIQQILTIGRLPMLDRLRGESDPIAVLSSVPGIGSRLAERLHDELDLETLEDLEAAAHDGRLERVAGFGAKRIAGIRDALATRLARRTTPVGAATDRVNPPIAELLNVDREYREASAAGRLRRIAPRRFNPEREAWLPVMHTWRGARHYTVLFSNTARAHQLGRTHDWVVLYFDTGHGERQYTVITATSGTLRGLRVVRGREMECERHYAER